MGEKDLKDDKAAQQPSAKVPKPGAAPSKTTMPPTPPDTPSKADDWTHFKEPEDEMEKDHEQLDKMLNPPDTPSKADDWTHFKEPEDEMEKDHEQLDKMLNPPDPPSGYKRLPTDSHYAINDAGNLIKYDNQGKWLDALNGQPLGSSQEAAPQNDDAQLRAKEEGGGDALDGIMQGFESISNSSAPKDLNEFFSETTPWPSRDFTLEPYPPSGYRDLRDGVAINDKTEQVIRWDPHRGEWLDAATQKGLKIRMTRPEDIDVPTETPEPDFGTDLPGTSESREKPNDDDVYIPGPNHPPIEMPEEIRKTYEIDGPIYRVPAPGNAAPKDPPTSASPTNQGLPNTRSSGHAPAGANAGGRPHDTTSRKRSFGCLGPALWSGMGLLIIILLMAIAAYNDFFGIDEDLEGWFPNTFPQIQFGRLNLPQQPALGDFLKIDALSPNVLLPPAAQLPFAAPNVPMQNFNSLGDMFGSNGASQLQTDHAIAGNGIMYSNADPASKWKLSTFYTVRFDDPNHANLGLGTIKDMIDSKWQSPQTTNHILIVDGQSIPVTTVKGTQGDYSYEYLMYVMNNIYFAYGEGLVDVSDQDLAALGYDTFDEFEEEAWRVHDDIWESLHGPVDVVSFPPALSFQTLQNTPLLSKGPIIMTNSPWSMSGSLNGLTTIYGPNDAYLMSNAGATNATSDSYQNNDSQALWNSSTMGLTIFQNNAAALQGYGLFMNSITSQLQDVHQTNTNYWLYGQMLPMTIMDGIYNNKSYSYCAAPLGDTLITDSAVSYELTADIRTSLDLDSWTVCNGLAHDLAGAYLLLPHSQPGQNFVANFPPTSTDTPTPSATPTATSTPTSTPTATATATLTPTATLATVSSLRGTITQKTNGHYAPGKPFMGPYGLPTGVTVTLTGRTDDGNWVLVSGRQDAWISVDSTNLNPNQVMSLPVMNPFVALPISNFYGPPVITSAVSNGTQATLEWNPIKIRIDLLPGYGVPIYIVAVNTCMGGKKVFLVVGTDDTTLTVPIDNGCGQSTGQVILQFKEGYARGTLIPLGK